MRSDYALKRHEELPDDEGEKQISARQMKTEPTPSSRTEMKRAANARSTNGGRKNLKMGVAPLLSVSFKPCSSLGT